MEATTGFDTAAFDEDEQTIAIPLTLAQLSREAVDAAGGDTKVAEDQLTNQLYKDADLLRTIIRAAIRDAVAYHVQHELRADRGKLIRALFRPVDTRAAVTALGEGMTPVVLALDFQLANGLKLRDAMREDVDAQAERYESFSRDMRWKAKWLRKIAEIVPDGTRVGDAIDDVTAEKLLREIKK